MGDDETEVDMSVLVFQHIECEGPGYIADFAAARDLELNVIRTFDETSIPDPRNSEALIVLGGPMNVYEEERYPWLVTENKAIQAAIANDVPYLGMCLGSQLLAKALGASVGRNPVEEIGFGDIRLSHEGLQDPIFRGLPNVVPAFHWHEDTWELPVGSTLLASSDACPHQAFRYGRAYGLQFHIETSPKMISDWIDEYSGQLHSCGLLEHADSMRAEAEARANSFRELTMKLMTNFWDHVVLQGDAIARQAGP